MKKHLLLFFLLGGSGSFAQAQTTRFEYTSPRASVLFTCASLKIKQ